MSTVPQAPAVRRAPEQEINFAPTVLFLVIGLIPIIMLFRFWFASGTGLHVMLVGYAVGLALSLVLSVNYFLYYRQHKPRSALVPPVLRGIVPAVILLAAGTFQLHAIPHGVALTLSPGPKIEAPQLPKVVWEVMSTKVPPGGKLTKKYNPPKRLDVKRRAAWTTGRWYLDGALWGALGYAIPFGLLACWMGLMRREIPDPRDEHLGSTMAAAPVRAAVGLYFGTAVGFMIGGLIIATLRLTFFDVQWSMLPDTVAFFMRVVGVHYYPNVAFQHALATGCLLAGALALVPGKGDIAVGLSDPKAPELTRPIEVNIPEVPDAPQQAFDGGRIQAESAQILQQFQQQVAKMLDGAEWEYEKYDLPPVGKAGKAAEPEATNLISAREPLDDDDGPSAMGSLSNVYVQIVAELGKLEVPAADWLGLAEGAILELPKSPDGTVGITINGKPAGRGRPLTVNGNKAVKMVGLRGPVDRLIKP